MFFPTIEEVKEGQLQQLTLYGGGEPGVLNQERLQSAVMQPQQTLGGQFLLSDIYEMGAGYLKYLVLGHAFGNGNKRVAIGTALEFLALNGWRVIAETEELFNLVLDCIQHRADITTIAEFFRTHGEPAAPLPEGADAVRRARHYARIRDWMHAQYADLFELLAQ